MPLHEEFISSKFKSLDKVPNSILPNYSGYGLTSLVPSVGRWLGSKALPSPAFGEDILRHFENRYRRVVVLLVDALGYNQLLHLMEEGYADFWRKKLDEGHLFPITSVTPSTTATALTTLWTGADPNQHGVIGFEMWHWQLGMVINNIFHQPTSFENDMGGLWRAGFDPNTFLGLEPVGSHFKRSGIEARAIMPAHIINSGLSRMHLADTQFHGYVAEEDMWITLRKILNMPSRQNQYVYAYWSLVDSLMHRFGTYAESVSVAFENFSRGLERLVLKELNPDLNQDTLFILSADHGSVTTPVNEDYSLANHPELRDMLVLPPTCEARLPFFYVKPWQDAAVRAYFDSVWPGKYVFMRREKALQMGLFGLGEDNADLRNRVGDMIAIPVDPEAYLWWPAKANRMNGRHGGLHQDEMLVPLFAFKA